MHTRSIIEPTGSSPDYKWPPGPQEPALLQLYKYLSKPLPFFDACAEKYGEIFTLNLGPLGRWVFVWSPDLVKQVYTAESSVFQAGAAKAGIFGPVVGVTSSLVLDGDAHLQRRRLLQPAFRGEQLANTTELIRRVTEQAIAEWPRDRWFSVHEHLQHIAFGAVLSGIFGPSISSDLPPALTRLVREALASRLLFLKFLQVDFGRFSPWGRVVRAIRAADDEIYREISRRRNDGGGHDDILGILLDTRAEDGTGLSDQEIRDEIVTMVTAGHEITGLSLSWALVSLSANPAALARARSEVDRVLGDSPLEQTHVNDLAYVESCVKESLRLNSAVANGSARRLVVPFELGGFTLPSGTMVNVCMHLLHHRSDVYPEPSRFIPERFLGTKINPYQWVPFGGGVRRCLGMAFGLHEMKVVLATLLQRLEFDLAGAEIPALRRGAFVYPSGGPKVRVRDRIHASTTRLVRPLRNPPKPAFEHAQNVDSGVSS